MPFSAVQNLLTTMDNHGGPAQPNRFFIQMVAPSQLSFLNNKIIDLSFQCHATELPGVVLNTNTYKTYGPGKQLPTIKIYNEITFSFICTNDFYEKAFFDGWIEYINPEYQNWDFRYVDEVSVNINIGQLGPFDDLPIFAVQLIKAFPIAIFPMALRWDKNNSYHNLDVTFAYSRYHILNSNLYNLMDGYQNFITNPTEIYNGQPVV